MDNFNNNNYNNNYSYNNNGNYEMNLSLLRTLSTWSGFLGIMNIIGGALTCLGAIGTFGLSLIPGIITIILGLKLRGTKEFINRYISGDKMAINGTIESLASYFKLQGILMIIGFVFAILFIVLIVIFGIGMASQFSYY